MHEYIVEISLRAKKPCVDLIYKKADKFGFRS